MTDYNLKHYAHLGDAVFELFVREYVVKKTHTQKQMHNMTTDFVNAAFQASIADMLYENLLNDNEKEIFKRGRNLPITVNKKNNPATHRLATAFEVIVGYLYINNKDRLNDIFKIIKKNLISTTNV